jgi:hypothetical protein
MRRWFERLLASIEVGDLKCDLDEHVIAWRPEVDLGSILVEWDRYGLAGRILLDAGFDRSTDHLLDNIESIHETSPPDVKEAAIERRVAGLMMPVGGVLFNALGPIMPACACSF